MGKKVALFLALLLIFSLFVHNAFARSIHSPQKIYSFTGEEIFRGIMFGQGEVAKLFPELWNNKTRELANTPKALITVDTYIEQISKKDIQYFENVKYAVMSGNPYKIDEIFSKGVEYLTDILESQGKLVKDPNDPIGINTILIWGLGIVAIAYVWVYAGFYTVFGLETYFSGSNEGTSKFTKEVVIAKIIERLSGKISY